MPYKYARRKKPYRKTRKAVPWYSRKYTAMSLAKKAWAGVWKLKGLVNSELLKKDVAESGTPVTSAGVYSVLLSPIAQGDGNVDRTGNSVFARALNIKGNIVYNSSGNTTQFMRIAVVLDTQQIGDTSPSYTDLYQSADYNSHVNRSTAGRFKILYSKVHQVDTVNNLSRPLNINIPMRHHIRFNGTASTDIQKGGIYILASSSEGTNGPYIRYDSRLSYHDN